MQDIYRVRYFEDLSKNDIAQLRRKLGVEIVSVRGVGYRMEIRPQEKKSEREK